MPMRGACFPVNVSRYTGSLCWCQSTAGVHRSGGFQAAVSSNSREEETAGHVEKRELILLLADLLAITLAGKRFFHALLFTGLQIKRVTLDFLDNVFSLHLALEAPQSILKGFAFLYSNLCQEKYTSKQSQSG
jgi:hypothetical protein